MLSITEQFQNLLEDVKDQVHGTFPVEGRKRILRAKNLRYDNAGAERMFDWEEIRKIKDNEGTFASNLRGDLELVDKETGKVVDTQKNAVLARVPHMTGLGSFVINGKDLQIVNQLRRRPGIYPSFTPDDNVRTKLTSTGADYDVILDRKTGQYLMKVGTSNLKLVPFLEGLGVHKKDIVSAIGEGSYSENAEAAGKRDEVLRFWNKVRSKAPAADRDQLVKDIHSFLESKPLDPDVSQETIGFRHDKISSRALLDAMRSAKEVAQGRRQPADMESLSFKSIHSVEDFVGDRLRKAIPGIKRNLGYIVDRAPKLKRIIGPDVLSKPIMSQFTTSEFTRYADQNNPIDILSKLQAVTVMGEGGISSIHRVTDEVRNLHSTHLGFIDPVHTAENQLIGLSNHLTEGVTKKGNRLYRQVYDVKQKKMVNKSPVELARAVVAFPDEYKVDDPKRPKAYTPRKSKVLAMNKGAFNEVPSKSVDYIIPTTSAPFSFATNAVPFLHSNSGARMLMAGRHMEQAVPLVDRDVPLVQSEYHGHPYNDVVGSVMLTKAKKSGVVTKAGPGEIHIRHDGEKKATKYKIPDHYALNSEAFMTENPIVKAGDKVKANQALTESNFSKNQSLAIGKNLITAFMPWKGHNFEDGIVISESAAKKLASEHKHEFKAEKDQHTSISAKKLFAQFPHLKTPEAWAEGRKGDLPQVGDVIKPGQILIPSITKNVLGPQTEYDRIHKALTKPFKDTSVRWMEMVDGEVVRVVNNPNFTKVYVKTREPMVIGDKLCFAPEHELLTLRGWLPVAEVEHDDILVTMNPKTGVIEYQNPTRLDSYECQDEPMYLLEAQQVSMRVTLDHRLYVQPRGREHYELIPAKDVQGKRVRFRKDAVWAAETPDHVEISAMYKAGGQGGVGDKEIEKKFVFKTLPFMKFLGLWLAEGSAYEPSSGGYRVVLAQSEKSEEGRIYIRSVLSDLELNFHETGYGFVMDNKALFLFLKECGDRAWNKKIPTKILDYGQDALSSLWEGFHVGDGTTNNANQEVLITSSPHLRDQFQEIALKTGFSANIKVQCEPGHETFIGDRKVTCQHTIYHIRRIRSKNRPQINHGHVKEQDGQREEIVSYTGKVYCLEVPNHLVYTRRDGKPHWSGNSTRHGSKGIVTKITPDNEMPRNADGETVDVLFNPYGIPGRMNPGIMFETAMGKVAQKTGKNITVKNFGDLKSQVKHVKEQLKKHGVTDTDKLYDPTHNKTHDNVLTGPLHWIKLKHQVRNKLSARGHQDAYTVDGRPAKGGVGSLDESTSAQSVGPLEIYSLMAGGQTEFLKDVAGLKSNRNVDYWNAYQLGLPTPPPVVPQVLDKFHKYLQGAGVNLRMDGNTIKALPMTDKEILKRSKGEISEPTVVRTSGPHLVEEKGGLFDRSITGGTAGKDNNWAHIELAEPILHPLYEAPAMALTGLKKKEFNSVLAGKTFVDKDGNFHDTPGPDRVTAGMAMERLLGKINVDTDLRSTRSKLRSVNKTDRPKLLKKIRYLSALKQMGLDPKEAFINKYIPVIPPSARPIYAMGDGNLNVADPNHGYREVLFVNRALKDLKKSGVEDDLLQPQREGLYRSVVGMVGLAEPMTRNANFKGFISAIAGQQNKYGLFQSQVVKRTQDLTGRSTLIVDPTLHVDEIGVPYKMAQKIYAPFAIRKMVTSYGLKPIDARTELEEMTPRAKKVLEGIADERPVIMNRAPSLHKFSTVAVKARLVPGQAIQVNPLIVGGLNADFDGDTAAIHVPVSEKARIQSWEKLPSRTLLSPKNLSVIHGPSKEAIYGLYAMTSPSNKKSVAVKSANDVLKLVRQNKLNMNDPVRYKNKTWTAGHIVINNDLPKEYQIDNQPLTGGRTKELINTLAKDSKYRLKAGDIITKLKDHGFTHATTLGTSISLDDLTSAQLDQLHKDIIPKINQMAKKNPLKAIQWGSDRAGKAMDKLQNNRLANLTYKSGAGGKYKGNVQQMVLAPVGVQDVKGNPVPVPITRGYAEGMNLGSYWATLPGMRKGIADRALATADTGAFAKELQNTTIHMRISEDDCGTKEGVELPINHPDVNGRFLASNGRMIDGSLMKSLRSKNVRTVKVRSPATCHAHSGICAKCMGLNEHGGKYNKGFHVGTLVGTTISEPLTQMVMRSFHHGGQVGQTEVGYKRIAQIFNMPANMRGKAPLSNRDGVVDKIIDTDRGGYEVHVDGVKHFVPTELDLKVKVGDKVKAGDKLSRHGIIHPRELAQHKGIEAARDLLLNDIDTEMRLSGQNIRRRIFEASIRPLIDKSIVTDPGDAEKKHSIQPGDVVNTNYARMLNKKLKRPMKIEPHLMSVKEVPFTSTDFIGPLMSQRLPRTLKQAPATGAVTKLKGFEAHPIVEFAYGKMAEEEQDELTVIWNND